MSNHSLTDLRRALTPTGMLIPNGGSFGNRWFASAGRLLRATVLFRFGGQRLGRFLVSINHADLVVLKELIEAGKVTPVMDRTYPLSDAARAMDHVGRACPGKGRDHRRMRDLASHVRATTAVRPTLSSARR